MPISTGTSLPSLRRTWRSAAAGNRRDRGLSKKRGNASICASRLFIASPALALLKEREPRYKALRKRLEERESRTRSRGELEAELATADAEPAVSEVQRDERTGAVRPSTKPAASAAKATGRPGTYSANHPPRPRKKGKRR